MILKYIIQLRLYLQLYKPLYYPVVNNLNVISCMFYLLPRVWYRVLFCLSSFDILTTLNNIRDNCIIAFSVNLLYLVFSKTINSI